MNLYGLVLKHF